MSLTLTLILSALAQAAPVAKIDGAGLALLGPDGKPRASIAMRADQLDTRQWPGGVLAMAIDENRSAVRLLRSGPDGVAAELPGLPGSALAVDAACLHRDAQGLEHLFVVAKDGQAEQWLWNRQWSLVRKMALPPQTAECKVDDATATLYVLEEDAGIWAYPANAETAPVRQPVALARPLGKLKSAPERIDLASLQRKRSAATAIPVLAPDAQTEPVARLGDAADDPAIWVHPADPARSRVLATNKKQGLVVYDLAGRQVQMLETGRINNIDLRQGVSVGGAAMDIAIATQRDDKALVLFALDSDGVARELARIATGLDEVYGVCSYAPSTGGLEAIVNDKDGRFRQFRVEQVGDGYRLRLLRSFALGSQPEGCVADDRNGTLFVGEEKAGVWKLAASGAAPARKTRVLAVGPLLKADVEGMALYHGDKASYLVVSSQGDNSYVVLDAAAPHRFRGKFRIGFNPQLQIDGASETDGLDVTSRPLGTNYPSGMLVVQDGYKRLPDGPQNFKYLSWSSVAAALKLD